MHIQTLSTIQTQQNFQGTVDKSVTKYLDKSVKIYRKNTINSRSKKAEEKIANYEKLITQVKASLDSFMKRCHPNTKLTLKDVKFPVLAKDFFIYNSSLPTSPNVNISSRLPIRFYKCSAPLGTETLTAVINGFDKELNPKAIDRDLLRYAMSNLEAKAQTNWLNRIIAYQQRKKLEKFSKEINITNN